MKRRKKKRKKGKIIVACDQLIRGFRTFSIRNSWNTVPLRGAVLRVTRANPHVWEATIPARGKPCVFKRFTFLHTLSLSLCTLLMATIQKNQGLSEFYLIAHNVFVNGEALLCASSSFFFFFVLLDSFVFFAQLPDKDQVQRNGKTRFENSRL